MLDLAVFPNWQESDSRQTVNAAYFRCGKVNCQSRTLATFLTSSLWRCEIAARNCLIWQKANHNLSEKLRWIAHFQGIVPPVYDMRPTVRFIPTATSSRTNFCPRGNSYTTYSIGVVPTSRQYTQTDSKSAGCTRAVASVSREC